jgi:hypothetical protein
MKTYKPLLLLTLLIWSSLGHAFNYSCIGKDDTIAPNPQTYVDGDGNTQYTDAMKVWQGTHTNWSTSKDWGCCEKLVLDGSTCKDSSIEDTTLQKCSAHGECGGELGCYPMTDDDMFTTDSEDEAVQDAVADQEDQYSEQQNSLGDEDPKPEGQACYRNMECESYSCVKFKCEAAQKICRKANKDEIAPGNIQCDEPLEKNSNLVCGDYNVPYFSGNLGQLLVVPKPGGTSCEFQLVSSEKDSAGNPLTDQHIQGAINLGIKTTRSMEWLYSSVSNADHVDCLWTREYMKKEMNKLIEERKEILKLYNDDMLFVEGNFKATSAAQAEDQNTTPTLCQDGSGNYEVVTFHDIAMRKATGIDFLCYMKERNRLYMAYEIKMKALMAKLNDVTSKYKSTVFNWGEKDKNWTTGNLNHEWKNRDCRRWPKWHKKTKRRWSERYKVSKGGDDNVEAITKPGVNAYLSFIPNVDLGDFAKASLRDALIKAGVMVGGQIKHAKIKSLLEKTNIYKDGKLKNLKLKDVFFVDAGLYKALKDAGVIKIVTHPLKSRSFYLIDPMMPGGKSSGLKFESFGRGRNLNGKHDRRLTGNKGLIDIYNGFGEKIMPYLASLRKDTSPELFILEPEISGSYEMRGCLNNSARPECANFTNYVNDLKDFAFAQMLAYSQHSKKKYKNFFKNEGTWRNNLFSRYETDLVNLQTYYEALSGANGLRTKQNECLDRLISGVNSDFANTEGSGIDTGLSNYYIQTSTNFLGGGGRGNEYNKPKIKGSSGTPKEFKLRAFNNSLKDNGGLKDASSSTTNAGSGSVDSASIGNGLLASRIKKIADTNEIAKKSGIDVAARSEEIASSMGSAGRISGGGGGQNAANSSASSGDSAAGKKATLDLDKESKDSKVSSVDPNLLRGAGSGAGSNAGSLSGIVGGAGSGYGAGEGAGSSNNPTGMSDEEKDIMAANYDRRKGEYKTNEDDSLFQVLSKTYVRNLDRILTRKKKLDEGSASFPSEPSKP